MVGPAKQATTIQPMVGSPPKAASPTRLTLVSKCSNLVNLHLKRGPHNLMAEEYETYVSVRWNTTNIVLSVIVRVR